jgi:8-oxo-dGTP pyrophosphatase MutT (NUDIX family)
MTIYDQSAVIPFRFDEENIKVLLITSVKSKQWIFPKGIIETNLSPQESAKKEAFEEAGVQGMVVDFLVGEYSYKKWGGVCNVKVFPMQVTEIHKKWPESDVRQRKWVSTQDAVKLLERDELKNQLYKLLKNLSKIRSIIKKS